jgi:D-alanyl-D-alanine dipeptidase
MKKQFLTICLALVSILIGNSFTLAQDSPPQEKNKREADLLELIKLDDTIKLDIRYARTDNFVGKAVYSEARAFLQRPAAEALLKVHRNLKAKNLGLVIFDGYRPWTVTKLFWEVTPEDKRKFVADPKKGSRHNRGCAVDLSIYDLKTGELLPMPSDFDEFTERASPDYKGGTNEELENRDLLRKLMEAEGFTVNKNEWWHFDYKDWENYAIYDVAFSDVRNFDLIKNFKIRRVDFSGNKQHRIKDFRKVIFLVEGEIVSEEKLKKTLDAINKLDIFERVTDLNVSWNYNEKEKDVDFIFYVKEKSKSKK